MLKVGILSISNEAMTGGAEDAGGTRVMEMVKQIGGEVLHYAVIPNEKARILTQIKNMAEQMGLDLIFTVGGIGLAPYDVTPEATIEVAERQVPGIAEVMRSVLVKVNPGARLYRGIAAIRKKSFIVNLPSDAEEIKAVLSAVMSLFPGAVEDIGKEVSQYAPQFPAAEEMAEEKADSSPEQK